MDMKKASPRPILKRSRRMSAVLTFDAITQTLPLPNLEPLDKLPRTVRISTVSTNSQQRQQRRQSFRSTVSNPREFWKDQTDVNDVLVLGSNITLDAELVEQRLQQLQQQQQDQHSKFDDDDEDAHAHASLSSILLKSFSSNPPDISSQKSFSKTKVSGSDSGVFKNPFSSIFKRSSSTSKDLERTTSLADMKRHRGSLMDEVKEEETPASMRSSASQTNLA